MKYRIWQFWQSLKSPPQENDWQLVSAVLSPEESAIFHKLPVPDQNHSLRVLRALQATGEQDPDLLKAALLHDLGKTLYPLKRWERVWAVLASSLFPRAFLRWGDGRPAGLCRALAVIKHHPEWGAQLAQEAGGSSRLVWLIRNHESPDPASPQSADDLILLRRLQEIDNRT